MLEFNKVLNGVEPSASMKLGLAGNDQDLLNLSIGIPDLDPPSEVGELLSEFCKKNKFPYIPSRGTLAARQRLSDTLFGVSERPDASSEIMLTAGAKFGIYLSLKTCTSFGDEIILMEPYWLSYPPMAISLGLNIRYWKPIVSDDGNLEFDLNWLKEQLLGRKVKALIINNPNNPSGKVFSDYFLSELIKLTAEYHCWMLIDEVYKHHTFDGELAVFQGMEHLVRIGSVSKSLSLPGIRLGYMVGSKSFIDNADLLSQHLLTCITPMSNHIAEHLDHSLLKSYVQNSVQVYHQRYLTFQQLFTDRFFVLQSEASFYALIRPRDSGVDDACEYLRDRFRIIGTPGSAYGSMFRSYARICLTVSSERIRQITGSR